MSYLRPDDRKEALKLADALQDIGTHLELETSDDLRDRETILRASRLIYELCGLCLT